MPVISSERGLELASRVPTEAKDEGVAKLHHAALTLSREFTLFTLVQAGKHLPFEKHRDDSLRHWILYSVAQYSLSPESLATILKADSDEKQAYFIGLAKNAQQVIRYTLYGIMGNYMYG